MATEKVTITLRDRQLAEIRKRVRGKRATSVSGFVQRAVEKSLENSEAFLAMLDEALAETGGPPTAKERAWVKSVLGPPQRIAKASRGREAA